jgi:hypothetical protein
VVAEYEDHRLRRVVPDVTDGMELACVPLHNVEQPRLSGEGVVVIGFAYSSPEGLRLLLGPG